MKILLIGGTGRISMDVSRLLIDRGHELYLVNRGNNNTHLNGLGVKCLTCDINDLDRADKLLDGMYFDAAADFIAYDVRAVERDYRLLKDRCGQYIFIATAAAYEKPPSSYLISEQTPLSNPYWQYARDKIACEEFLMKLFWEDGFPVTIVRPSHTYDDRTVPLAVKGRRGSWQVIKRMLEGRQVIIHGDGTSLWTCTHSEDFAKGFSGLVGNTNALGKAVHITSHESLTWNQIYSTIADVLGVKLKPYYVPSVIMDRCSDMDFEGALLGDKANTVVFDNSRLRELVPDFRAEISFRQGMERVLANLLQSPELQTEDVEFDRWCDTVIDEMEEAVCRIRERAGI